MMCTRFSVVVVLVMVVIAIGCFAQDGASQVSGRIVAPPSTTGNSPAQVRTPLYVFIPDGHVQADIPNGETPASIACVYGVVKFTAGCPKNGSLLPTGGSNAIAVVDYGHNSTLQSDFNTFNAYFGLPAQTLTFICDCGSCPSNNGTGWDLETALDAEWAHAMAPNAQIIVSEFCNDPYDDLPVPAELLAGQAVAAAGGGEVSNSFGYSGEFSGELADDAFMQVPTVVYFSSAGDTGLGASYPSVSPYSISVGGTHINRGGSGNFLGTENCWSGSGGGLSLFESRPAYQNIVAGKVGSQRGTPDASADADPATGVLVYSTTGCSGWCQVGGTSIGSPLLAGITNASAHFLNSTNIEGHRIYVLEYTFLFPWLINFRDIVAGGNPPPATIGWDTCTGLGSPKTLKAF